MLSSIGSIGHSLLLTSIGLIMSGSLCPKYVYLIFIGIAFNFNRINLRCVLPNVKVTEIRLHTTLACDVELLLVFGALHFACFG